MTGLDEKEEERIVDGNLRIDISKLKNELLLTGGLSGAAPKGQKTLRLNGGFDMSIDFLVVPSQVHQGIRTKEPHRRSNRVGRLVEPLFSDYSSDC